MTTALVTNAWLASDEYRQRLHRWSKHHFPIAQANGWRTVALENGSASDRDDLPRHDWFNTHIRFDVEYTRPRILEYPYAWRAFTFFQVLFDWWEFDRVIFVENDAFLLSDRIVHWRNTAQGMQSPFCPKYQCPEAAIITLTKDCALYRRFTQSKRWQDRHDENFELVAPWTHIERLFIGDRYEGVAIPEGVDFAAQVGVEFALPAFVGGQE